MQNISTGCHQPLHLFSPLPLSADTSTHARASLCFQLRLLPPLAAPPPSRSNPSPTLPLPIPIMCSVGGEGMCHPSASVLRGSTPRGHVHAPPQGGGWVSWSGVVSAPQKHTKAFRRCICSCRAAHMHTRVTIAHVHTAHHHQVGGVRGAQSSEDSGPLVVGSSVARNPPDQYSCLWPFFQMSPDLSGWIQGDH